MPITRRSRRTMTPLARKVAELHNDAAKLARRLRSLCNDVLQLELPDVDLNGKAPKQSPLHTLLNDAAREMVSRQKRRGKR